ncbi:hypothetical protein MPG29_07850 (plasmid) [Helicobacter pylori]|nr:hypothetical protein MPG29_07850 [Helicobacter pylori]
MQKLWGKKVIHIDFSEFVKILENKAHVVKNACNTDFFWIVFFSKSWLERKN